MSVESIKKKLDVTGKDHTLTIRNESIGAYVPLTKEADLQLFKHGSHLKVVDKNGLKELAKLEKVAVEKKEKRRQTKGQRRSRTT